MNLCVIPARAGSKRIKKKNIKLFCGKPIIAWSIKAAIASKCFDKIIVSTDDGEIAKIATKYGAEVPFMRPKKLSNDYAGTSEVISHAIKWHNKRYKKISYVCCVYATAPFVRASDLRNALKIFKKSSFDYIFSATEFAYPIQRSFKIKKNQKIEMFFPKFYNLRSQDLDEAFHDAGQFYWGTVNSWLNNKCIFGKNSYPMLIPRNRAHDINTPLDWKIAKKMFEINKKNS